MSSHEYAKGGGAKHFGVCARGLCVCARVRLHACVCVC
jgi:hypothetical protein